MIVPYDTVDAQLALQRLAAALSNGKEKQREACIRLLQEVAGLQAPPGMKLRFSKEYECLEIETGRMFRRIWVGGPGLKFKISEQIQEDTTRDLDVLVEYDAVSDMLVGTDDDPAIVPTPGAKRRKRDALVVAIDAIAKQMHRG